MWVTRGSYVGHIRIALWVSGSSGSTSVTHYQPCFQCNNLYNYGYIAMWDHYAIVELHACCPANYSKFHNRESFPPQITCIIYCTYVLLCINYHNNSLWYHSMYYMNIHTQVLLHLNCDVIRNITVRERSVIVTFSSTNSLSYYFHL